MANDVFANGREIACKAGSGKTICAFPDVCFTPPENPATPPGVPVPYPNTGFASDTTKGSKSVKISDKEIMLKNKSCFKKSTGDEAGCAAKKGVITSTNKGEVYFKAWSMDVKVEGENVDRHLDLTTNNHASDPGDTPPMLFTDEMFLKAMEVWGGAFECGDPHFWVLDRSKTPDETKKENSALAASLNKKKQEGAKRGYLFENKSIDKNMEKMKIEKTSAEYVCVICGVNQEVDIVGKDQVAESKSRNINQVKKKGRQSRNIKQIQKQLFGSNSSPLAKLDGTLGDVADSAEKYNDRSFAIEIVF